MGAASAQGQNARLWLRVSREGVQPRPRVQGTAWRSFFGKHRHTEKGTSLFLPQPDAYDRMVRELGFEMKAQPSNRMKTEQQLAEEEQERLRRLEVRVPVLVPEPGRLAAGRTAVTRVSASLPCSVRWGEGTLSALVSGVSLGYLNSMCILL